MPHNLVAILRELKPRRALFTTYTFNPAFFEAAVMPAAFRPDGCQIRVLVDAGPLAESTIGSFAQHIGSRYAVAPVRVPGGGIFHPKIALLDGDDRQVLCVGSANLTAFGLARQLECLDVIDLGREQLLASVLKGFLLSLSQRCSHTSPRAADMLTAAAAWVRAGNSNSQPQERHASLLHTLDRPIDEQFAEFFHAGGQDASTLTVLAPFHSRDGAAVQSLRQKLGAKALRIAHVGTVQCGVDAYPGATYVAPHDLEPGADGTPALHAKIFEVMTDSAALVLTGSINATFQSLSSKRNVEVGIARWKENSPFGWNEQAPTHFEPREEMFQPVAAWTMEALLIGNDRLEALLSGKGTAGANIEWVLEASSAEFERGTVNVDERGVLTIELAAPISAAHDALILRIHGRSGMFASAWVNDHRALRAARDGVRLKDRSGGTGETGSDYRFAADLILRALDGQAIQLRSSGARAERPESQSGSDSLEEAFNYEHWVRSGHLRRAPGMSLNRDTGTFLLRVLDLLLPSAGGGPDERTQEIGDFALGEAEPSDEDGEQRSEGDEISKRHNSRPARAADRDHLLNACLAIRTAFESGREGIASAEMLALAVCAFELERAQAHFLQPSLSDPRMFDPHRVLVIWLNSISDYPFEDNVRQDLLPLACALAATTAAVPPQLESGERHLPQLRGAIDRLAGSPVAGEVIADLVVRGMREEIMLRVDRRLRSAGLAQASALARAPALDELLWGAISIPAAQRTPKSMAAIGAALARWSKRSSGLALLTGDHVRSGGCPICYRHFTSQERRDLAYQRWMVHAPGRPHVLVYPLDIKRFADRQDLP